MLFLAPLSPSFSRARKRTAKVTAGEEARCREESSRPTTSDKAKAHGGKRIPCVYRYIYSRLYHVLAGVDSFLVLTCATRVYTLPSSRFLQIAAVSEGPTNSRAQRCQWDYYDAASIIMIGAIALSPQKYFYISTLFRNRNGI